MKAKGINLLMLFAAVLVTGMLAVNAQEAVYSNGDLTLLDNCSSDEIKGVVQDFHLCIGKKKIGDYRTVQYEQDGLTYYCGQSKAEIWLFGKIKIDYHLECVFDDSVLLYSLCTGLRNGKERVRSEIVQDGSDLKSRQNSGPWANHDPVHTTMIKLYYDEPVVGETTVIEATLVNKAIIAEDKGTYLLQEPGKKGVSEVVYNNGLLERVNVHYAIFNFSVVRKEINGISCDCSGFQED